MIFETAIFVTKVMQMYFRSEYKEQIRRNGDVIQEPKVSGNDSACARCLLRSPQNRPENMPETKVDCSRTIDKQKRYTV